jgi:DNA modification methylase
MIRDFESVNGKLYKGDCLEVMKDIADKSVDLILCDLPYGTTQNKWDSIIDLPLLWEQYERIIKDRGAIVLTAQTPFDKVLGCSNLKLLKYEWIWQKSKATGHLNAKKMPMKNHENVLVFYKNMPTYNPQMTFGHKPTNSKKVVKSAGGTNYGKCLVSTKSGNTDRYPLSIQSFTSINGNSKSGEIQIHPTQKPIALFEYMIRTYTNEGDIVLDNCSGSGTTGIAAINTNRNFILIESDDNYYNLSSERIEKHIVDLQESLF